MKHKSPVGRTNIRQSTVDNYIHNQLYSLDSSCRKRFGKLVALISFRSLNLALTNLHSVDGPKVARAVVVGDEEDEEEEYDAFSDKEESQDAK